MRRLVLIAVLVFLIVPCCNRSSKVDGIEYVRYGGMEREDVWTFDNAWIENGILRLRSSDATAFSMVTQLLPPLESGDMLLLTVVSRSPDATSSLEVDLYGFGFDDPRQQLSIPVDSLSGTFKSYSALVPSLSSDRGIWLRIFTESRTPVEVDAVSLHTVDSPMSINTG